MMAADCKGTGIKTIERAMTREDLIACGATLVSSDKQEDHKIDMFRICHEKGSISRALVNGLLDIATGFFWELAATPIEMSYGKESYYRVKVVFDSEDKIESIEIL